MKIKRQYIGILKLLSCGDDVYDSTLAQCVPEHKITKDGRVVAVFEENEIDILPIYTTARVANKMTEFILKNGALALGGIWNADDDGVVNLNNVNLIPGAIIPKAVGSKGFESLKPGHSFNISWDMVVSLQKQIRDYFEKAKGECNLKKSDENTTLTAEKLREMMRDPKYWRDQDADYVKLIENGFKKLYA